MTLSRRHGRLRQALLIGAPHEGEVAMHNSYYATLTMGEATDMQSWLDLIEQESGKDLANHKITMLHKPVLQICGNPSVEVIGDASRAE